MASEDVAARVREIMAGLFALDPSEINDASAIDTVEKWARNSKAPNLLSENA